MLWLTGGLPSHLQALVRIANYVQNKSELISQTEECLDLQYATAKANNPVGLYSCAGLANAGAGDKGINWPPVNATTTS
jgi:hypothetical protein